MSEMPNVEVGHMDLSTGAYVRDGEASTVYLTVAGVRVRASVHRLTGKAELDLTIDAHWTAENHVNALDVIEVRAHKHQAAIRVRGTA